MLISSSSSSCSPPCSSRARRRRLVLISRSVESFSRAAAAAAGAPAGTSKYLPDGTGRNGTARPPAGRPARPPLCFANASALRPLAISSSPTDQMACAVWSRRGSGCQVMLDGVRLVRATRSEQGDRRALEWTRRCGKFELRSSSLVEMATGQAFIRRRFYWIRLVLRL